MYCTKTFQFAYIFNISNSYKQTCEQSVCIFILRNFNPLLSPPNPQITGAILKTQVQIGQHGSPSFGDVGQAKNGGKNS